MYTFAVSGNLLSLILSFVSLGLAIAFFVAAEIHNHGASKALKEIQNYNERIENNLRLLENFSDRIVVRVFEQQHDILETLDTEISRIGEDLSKKYGPEKVEENKDLIADATASVFQNLDLSAIRISEFPGGHEGLHKCLENRIAMFGPETDNPKIRLNLGGDPSPSNSDRKKPPADPP